MQTITWAPELATGFKDMDALHQAMVEAMLQVSQADDTRFESVFRDFIASVESDFRSEEIVMEMVPYPEAQTHCEHHARVLSALHHTFSQVMQGDVASGRKTMQLLFQWFTVHIETLDRGLAAACAASSIDVAETSK
jgi:hemerythrin-like metal-binding protein